MEVYCIIRNDNVLQEVSDAALIHAFTRYKNTNEINVDINNIKNDEAFLKAYKIIKVTISSKPYFNALREGRLLLINKRLEIKEAPQVQERQLTKKEIKEQLREEREAKLRGLISVNTLKHFLLVTLIMVPTSFLIGALSSTVAGKVGASKSAEYNKKLSVFENTDYDYRVYDPANEQVETIRNNEFVNKAFEYYSTEVDITCDKKSFTTKAIYSSNIDDLTITDYNKARLVEGSMNLTNNGIYLDKSVANMIGANLDDEVSFVIRKKVLNFKVSAIFEDNRFYQTGSVYFHLSEGIKNKLEESGPLYLDGIIIDAKNNKACYEYLKEYEPLGLLKGREFFDTDLEYQDYLDRFHNTDYSDDIYIKENEYEAIKNRGDTLKLHNDSKNILLSTGIVTAILILSLSFILFMTKRYVLNQQHNQVTVKTKVLVSSYSIILLTSFIVYLVSMFVFIPVVTSGIAAYSGYVSSIRTTLGLSSLAYFVLALIDLIGVSTLNRKGF